MAVSPSARQKIIACLNLVAPIDGRNMFGGVGLYTEGRFFALIAEDILYFKVDDTNRKDYESAGMNAFSPFGPSRGVMQYYQVPDAVLDNVRKLKVWMDRSIQVALQAEQKKTNLKKRRSRQAIPRN
jgi:DNA transformation protein and related proteins